MGMGYCAAWADVMGADDVEKICPKQYRALLDAIDVEDETLASIASSINGCGDEISEPVESALFRLCKTFQKKTKLTLSLGYYNPDDGDRYDTIGETFWEVEGVWQYTPAGKKYGYLVQREAYVIYG